MSNIQPINSNAPLVDQDGRLTPVGLRLLEDLRLRMNKIANLPTTTDTAGIVNAARNE